MKAKLLLRIAAIIMLLHGIGHTIGVATWKSKGDVPVQVVQVMQDVQFTFMGKSGSTMAGFYSGFGYCGTIFLLFLAVLLWVLSAWKDKSANKILWVTAIAILTLAVDEIIYFFLMAVVFCLVSAALVLLSIWQFNKNKV